MPIDRQQYDPLASRRTAIDRMLWRTPALSLTAQSFLFSVALGSEIAPAARVGAALLALVASLASMQLMSKHRYHELQDSKLLREFEDAEGFVPIHGPRFWENRQIYQEFSSYKVWQSLLAVFSFAAITIALAATFAPEMLSSTKTPARACPINTCQCESSAPLSR